MCLTERPHTLGVDDQRTYAEEIEFIHYRLDPAEYRLEQLRRVQVVAPHAEAPALTDVAERARRDPSQSVSIRPEPAELLVEEIDVVLHIQDLYGVSADELVHQFVERRSS
ncbi:hypothetical protein [Pseudonocardia spinosispora]|uniref:hypothetical protein n=1 Tax=Pseudonocardia spinosispora TaxID=103441 RepID=UPI0004901754|nr:hypothetical protein [Pseudonocardia spinosispora]